MASILSPAGIMDSIENKRISKREIDVFDFKILKLIGSLKLEIRNLRNIIPDKILQVLKLSKLSVIGSAKKRGIDLTKSIVELSSEANIV